MKDIQILSPTKRKRTFLLSTSKKTNADDHPNSTQLDAASPKIILLKHSDEHSAFIDCSTEKANFNGREAKDIIENSRGGKEVIDIYHDKYEDCGDKNIKRYNSRESRSPSPSSTSHSHSQADSPYVNTSSKLLKCRSEDLDSNDVITYTDYENDSNYNSINETDNVMKKELESLQIDGKKFKEKGSYMETLFGGNEFDDHNDGNSINSTLSPCTQRRSFTYSESDRIRFPREDYLTSCDSDDDRHLPSVTKNWMNWKTSANSSIDVDDQGTVSDSNDVAGHLSCLHIKRTRTVLNNTDELFDEESDSTSLRSFVNSRNTGISRRDRVIVNDSCTSFVDTLTSSCFEEENNNGSPVLKSPRRNDSRILKMKDNRNQNGQIISNVSSSPTSGSFKKTTPRVLPSQFVTSTATITPHIPSASQGLMGSMDAADFMGDLGTPVKEVGSPGDIDMDTDLEVEENDNGFYSPRKTNGICPDSPYGRNTDIQNDCNKDYNKLNLHSLNNPGNRRNNPGKYEENFGSNHRALSEINMDSHNVSNISNGNNSICSNHEDFVKKYTNYDFKNVYSRDNYDYENDENNDSDDESQKGKRIQHANSYDISDRDYSFDNKRRGSFTFNAFPSYPSCDSNASFSSSFTSNDKNGIKGFLGGDRAPRLKVSPRPLPDQSAFNAIGSHSYRGPETPGKGSICPATPIRTPLWKSERSTEIHYPDSDNSTECSLYSLPKLTRQSSLTENKILVSLSDSISTSDVSFSRDFESEGFLGSGNFSDVYKVREKDGKVYAVKKSKRQFRSKKDRALFMGEVKMMKKMIEEPCDHIVKLIRAWQEHGYFFVQLDLAERGTLKELFMNLVKKREYLKESTIWHIVHDVASGLQHIHQCGVVHLDVKPANLLISNEGVIKIGDFGMATDIGKGEDGHEGDSGYMAPELLDSSDRYPPADVFSLGLALYESCIFNDHSEIISDGLSALPSEGPDWHVLRHGEAPSLSAERYSETLCSLITGTMKPRPIDRPTTENILRIPQAVNTRNEVDQVLISATNITASRPVRSGSYVPTMNLDFNSDGHLQVVTGPFGNPNLINSALNWHDESTTTPESTHMSSPKTNLSPRSYSPGISTRTGEDSLGISTRTGEDSLGISTRTGEALMGDGFYSSRTDVSGLYSSRSGFYSGRSGFYSSRTDQSACSSRTNSFCMIPPEKIAALIEVDASISSDEDQN